MRPFLLAFSSLLMMANFDQPLRQTEGPPETSAKCLISLSQDHSSDLKAVIVGFVEPEREEPKACGCVAFFVEWNICLKKPHHITYPSTLVGISHPLFFSSDSFFWGESKPMFQVSIVLKREEKEKEDRREPSGESTRALAITYLETQELPSRHTRIESKPGEQRKPSRLAGGTGSSTSRKQTNERKKRPWSASERLSLAVV